MKRVRGATGSDGETWGTGDKNKYGMHLVAVCSGRPGDSVEVDRQYYERSPINFMERAVGLPLEIAAGVDDGHGSGDPVPVRHTLEAFNVLAKAQGKPVISEEEIRQLSRPTRAARQSPAVWPD